MGNQEEPINNRKKWLEKKIDELESKKLFEALSEMDEAWRASYIREYGQILAIEINGAKKEKQDKSGEMKCVCEIKYDGDLVPATLGQGKGVMFRNPQYKAFREVVSWLYKSNYAGECRNDRLYKVEIRMEQNTTGNRRRFYRGDIDNLTKPILDSATGIIWKDDSQVAELHIKLDREGKTPGFKATIYEVGYWHHYRKSKTCLNCNTEFEVTLSRAEKVRVQFCSNTCRLAYSRIKKNCLYCDKEFTYRRSAERGTKFCSKECYWEYMREHPEEYTLNKGRPRKVTQENAQIFTEDNE